MPLVHNPTPPQVCRLEHLAALPQTGHAPWPAPARCSAPCCPSPPSPSSAPSPSCTHSSRRWGRPRGGRMCRGCVEGETMWGMYGFLKYGNVSFVRRHRITESKMTIITGINDQTQHIKSWIIITCFLGELLGTFGSCKYCWELLQKCKKEHTN